MKIQFGDKNGVGLEINPGQLDAACASSSVSPEPIPEEVWKACYDKDKVPQSILYRDHRGGLDESMATAKEYKTAEELRCYLTNIWAHAFPHPHEITCEFYGHDSRINWDSHIVCINGSPVGFANQMIDFGLTDSAGE